MGERGEENNSKRQNSYDRFGDGCVTQDKEEERSRREKLVVKGETTKKERRKFTFRDDGGWSVEKFTYLTSLKRGNSV